MSVNIDLLPDSIQEEAKEQQNIIWLILGILLVLAAAAAVWFWKQGTVDEAVTERNSAQVEVNTLQSEVNSLQAFQELADQRESGNITLATAMAGEIAVAQLLNDVAISLPNTASLEALTMNRTDSNRQGAGSISLGETVGDLVLEGYSVEHYAPGIEGVLIQFDDASGIAVTFLESAENDVEINRNEVDESVRTDFTATGLLTEDIFTGRYDAGLPAEEETQ